MELWLYIIAGGGFMHADTSCAIFTSREDADAFIKKAYGVSHEEILEAQEIMQNWIEENFQDDEPYPYDWCVRIFADGEQSDWDYMLDQQSIEMPYGLIRMEQGVPEMVIGQGSYMNERRVTP